MNCLECDATMTESVGNHDYSECGLPVKLRGVVVRRCRACGSDEVAIPNIEDLHRRSLVQSFTSSTD